MGNELKKSVPAFVALFGGALVIALLARVGLAVMDATGALGYNYRAATAPYLTDGLSTLDKLPFTLTGGTLVGFIMAGGLALCLAMATALVFARLFAGEGEGKPGTALVWGFLSAIVQFACLFIVVLGLYSQVLLSQMTKGGGGALGITLVMLLLAVGTLTAAACTMLHAAERRGGGSPMKTAVQVLLCVLVCGAVVCALVCVCFPAINAESASAGAIAGLLAVACVCNLALLFVGRKLAK